MIPPWCAGWVFWWRVKSVLLLTSVGVDHAQGQYQFLFFQDLMDGSRVLLGEYPRQCRPTSASWMRRWFIGLAMEVARANGLGLR